jgi:hypothetical protein
VSRPAPRRKGVCPRVGLKFWRARRATPKPDGRGHDGRVGVTGGVRPGGRHRSNGGPAERNGRKTLEEYERRIRRCFDSQWELAESLRELRNEFSDDGRFLSYCREWLPMEGMEGIDLMVLVRSVEARDNLVNHGCDPLPRFVHQVKPIAFLQPGEQVKMWAEMCNSNGRAVPRRRPRKTNRPLFRHSVPRFFSRFSNGKENHPSSDTVSSVGKR